MGACYRAMSDIPRVDWVYVGVLGAAFVGAVALLNPVASSVWQEKNAGVRGVLVWPVRHIPEAWPRAGP